MNAERAKWETKEQRLIIVEREINNAIIRGEDCCVINMKYWPDIKEWLNKNGYKYDNGVIRW